MRKVNLLVLFLFTGAFFLSSQAMAGPTFKIMAMSQIKEVSQFGYVDLFLDAPIDCGSGNMRDKVTVALGPVKHYTQGTASLSYFFANYTNLVNAAQKSLLVELVNNYGAYGTSCASYLNTLQYETNIKIYYQ